MLNNHYFFLDICKFDPGDIFVYVFFHTMSGFKYHQEHVCDISTYSYSVDVFITSKSVYSWQCCNRIGHVKYLCPFFNLTFSIFNHLSLLLRLNNWGYNCICTFLGTTLQSYQVIVLFLAGSLCATELQTDVADRKSVV